MPANSLFDDFDHGGLDHGGGDAAEQPPLFTPEQAETFERLLHMKALLAVHEIRLEQVTKWGHSDESDADQPVWWHIREGKARLDAAYDILRSDKPDRLETARKSLVKGLALGLAGIDRLDAAILATERE